MSDLMDIRLFWGQIKIKSHNKQMTTLLQNDEVRAHKL